MPTLSPAQLSTFATEGYLVVEDVLDPTRDLQPLWDEYAAVLDGLATTLHRDGVISSPYRDLSFCDRLIQVCVESGRNFPQHFDLSLPQTGVERETPLHVGPAVFGLLRNSHLLDVVEDICGPEIYSNPVQHIRMKLPKRAVAAGSTHGLVTTIPWHQDNGVVLPEADRSTILTIWLPLNAATVENGCLQVIPRSHRDDLWPHCPTAKGAAIPDALLADAPGVPLPLRAGSLLLMHQRTIHSSLDNTTESQVRVSLDLRYQPVGQPTGRPAFPGFIARSTAHPERVLRDPMTWAQSWYEARDRLAAQETPRFNRWQAGVGVCA